MILEAHFNNIFCGDFLDSAGLLDLYPGLRVSYLDVNTLFRSTRREECNRDFSGIFGGPYRGELPFFFRGVWKNSKC